MGSACRRRGASDTARQAGSGKRAALAGSAAGSGPGCRVAAVESWCGAQQRARDRAGFCAPETRGSCYTRCSKSHGHYAEKPTVRQK
ncbi:uncharacterized protein LOC143273329 isoform X2 [Peromyscus maniculatus bairdii]|uniref:uncharacterized protein LOC143273329 isoform X2 n=1 Tax=Peromyscus maniculatus bairdii TaxID=230844 RepID=UPI003FD03B90